MTNGKEYYAEDLKTLRRRVRQCRNDVAGILVYFMAEANIHPSGIHEEVSEEIKKEAVKFMKNCECMNTKRKSLTG
jgi:hypothetical protein